jgi:hypothetical protein
MKYRAPRPLGGQKKPAQIPSEASILSGIPAGIVRPPIRSRIELLMSYLSNGNIPTGFNLALQPLRPRVAAPYGAAATAVPRLSFKILEPGARAQHRARKAGGGAR